MDRAPGDRTQGFAVGDERCRSRGEGARLRACHSRDGNAHCGAAHTAAAAEQLGSDGATAVVADTADGARASV